MEVAVTVDADILNEAMQAAGGQTERQLVENALRFFAKAQNGNLDEQIVAAALKRNPKRVTLPNDENGNVIIDKDKHPEIYDWAANG